MKEIILKFFGLPIYKKGDKFIFEGIGKFKILKYYKHLKSYDCEFFEFDKQNKDKKTYQIISQIEIETNILIHKIDNKNKFIFGNSVNIEGNGNVVIQK